MGGTPPRAASSTLALGPAWLQWGFLLLRLLFCMFHVHIVLSPGLTRGSYGGPVLLLLGLMISGAAPWHHALPFRSPSFPHYRITKINLSNSLSLSHHFWCGFVVALCKRMALAIAANLQRFPCEKGAQRSRITKISPAVCPPATHSGSNWRRRQTGCHAAEDNGNGSGDHGPIKVDPAHISWDSTTSKLVGLASVPFSILVLPQVITNYANIASGNAAALSVISWQVRRWQQESA